MRLTGLTATSATTHSETNNSSLRDLSAANHATLCNSFCQSIAPNVIRNARQELQFSTNARAEAATVFETSTGREGQRENPGISRGNTGGNKNLEKRRREPGENTLDLTRPKQSSVQLCSYIRHASLFFSARLHLRRVPAQVISRI